MYAIRSYYGHASAGGAELGRQQRVLLQLGALLERIDEIAGRLWGREIPRLELFGRSVRVADIDARPRERHLVGGKDRADSSAIDEWDFERLEAGAEHAVASGSSYNFV